MENLQKGDNVFVRVDENHTFHDTYGIVKEIKNKKVFVELDQRFSHLCIGCGHYSDTIIDFEKGELEKFNLEDQIEIWATRLYTANGFHHLFELPYKFSPLNDCMYNKCTKKATQTILFNANGSVFNHHVCDEHASYNGGWGDEFPMADDYKAVVKEKIENDKK